MTRDEDPALSSYTGRRARYEHERSDSETRRIRTAGLVDRAGAAGLETAGDLAGWLDRQGLPLDVPRLSGLADRLGQPSRPLPDALGGSGLSDDTFALVDRALAGRLAVPHFGEFRNRLTNMYAYAAEHGHGQLAAYIPELAKQDPDAFGLSACTIDAQQVSLGRADEAFCLQSVVKPLNYALAMALNGEKQVHRHVGREPSGRRFNELALDPDNRPHNPMINSGAIMCCALIRPARPVPERLDLMRRFVASAAGGSTACGFDRAVYESERRTAKRNLSLVKLMDEHDAFPEGTDTAAALDLYFRSCALTLDCRALSVVAAMLANGGVCPLTGHRVIDAGIVRNTLSLMLTCGMYDYSGEFAFTVGLPAKSGVSGGLMIVVPGVAGFGLWSPPLDRQGNPVRGVEFARRLVDAYPFHIFAGVARD